MHSRNTIGPSAIYLLFHGGLIMPSVLSQGETIEALEEFLKYAKAGLVEVQSITVADGLWKHHTEITFRRIVPNLLSPRPSETQPH